MSTSAIDQLFPIQSAHRNNASPVNVAPVDSAEGERFRSHLERASAANEPKQPVAHATEETTEPETDELNDADTQQQSTTTAEEQQTPTTSEAEQQATDTTDESEATEQPTDEVILSVAAATQVLIENSEIIVTPDQPTDTNQVENVASPNDQQQASEQSANPNDNKAPTAPVTESFVVTPTGESVVAIPVTEATESSEVSRVTPTIATTADTTSAAAEQVPSSTNNNQQQSAASNEQSSHVHQTANTSVAPTSQAANQQPSGQQQPTSQGDGEERASEPDSNTNQSEKPKASFGVRDAAAAVDAETLQAKTTDTADTTSVKTPTATTSNHDGSLAALGRTAGGTSTEHSASSSSAAGDANLPDISTVDRARFVHRVSGAIRTAQQRDGQIQLRLSPPELGTLKIQITMSEGMLAARLETETAAARNLLLDNLPLLRERLAEQSIRIEKFDVDVGRDGQQQAENSDAEQQQQNKSRTPTNLHTGRQTTPNAATRSNNLPSALSSTSGLDVRI